MVMVLTSTLTIMAQITTSALSGKVTTQDTKEEVIGATVLAKYISMVHSIRRVILRTLQVSVSKKVTKLPLSVTRHRSTTSHRWVVHSISNLRNNQTIQVIYQGELLSGFPFLFIRQSVL